MPSFAAVEVVRTEPGREFIGHHQHAARVIHQHIGELLERRVIDHDARLRRLGWLLVLVTLRAVLQPLCVALLPLLGQLMMQIT
jgi:CHASE3 domain sensor protein